MGDCLSGSFNWNRTCDYQLAPPDYMSVGDVLIYHGSSCTDGEAHATFITSITDTVNIACHSPDTYDQVTLELLEILIKY